MATRRMIKLDPEAEAKIASLAEEAEAGFAPEQIRSPRVGRPPTGDGFTHVVQFRVEDSLFEALLGRAHQEDTRISAVAREALEAYLRPDSPALRDKHPAVIVLMLGDIAAAGGEGESRRARIEELTSGLGDVLGPLSEEDIRMAERAFVEGSRQVSTRTWLSFVMADWPTGERSLKTMLQSPYSSILSQARDQCSDDPQGTPTITGVALPVIARTD